MTESTPELTDECWPVTIPSSQQTKWDGVTQTERDQATALAVWTLRTLTLGLVGGCPVTVRPCLVRHRPPTWRTYPVDGGLWAASVVAGTLTDGGCDPSCGCSPDRLHSIELPPPVGPVSDVTIDGATLDPSAYFVDAGRLVRVDGNPWPTAQNLNLPDTEPGTWSVTYLNGAPVDGLGALAAGALAIQWLDGLTRGECRLPATAVAVARQGTSLQLRSQTDSSLFPDGRTGVDIADAYIERFNPNHLKQQSSVVSPDVLSMPRRRHA